MLWETNQQGQGAGKATVEELEARVDRLTLTCRAMWEMLREQMKVTDEQLQAKMVQIDIRDGKLDGK